MNKILFIFLILTSICYSQWGNWGWGGFGNYLSKEDITSVYDYSSQADALFARMDIQPDANRKLLIDNTIIRLLNNNLWNTAFEALWFTAAHDSQAATLNLIIDDHNLTASAGITFVTDRGFVGNIASSSYLATDFNPRVDSSGIYQNNDASIGSYVNTNNVEDHTFLIGNSGGGTPTTPATGNIIRTRSWQCKTNEGTSGYGEIAHSGRYMGLVSTQRTDATTNKIYYNKYLQKTTTLAVGTYLLNGTFHLLRNANTGLNRSGNRIALSWIARAFTNAEHDTLYNIFYDYLSEIGAADIWSNDTLVVANFEGTGFDNYNQWVETSTPDEDYTTISLRGAQSYNFPDGTNSLIDFALAKDTICVSFRVQFADATPSANVDFLFIRNGATALGYWRQYASTGRIYFTYGGQSIYGTQVLSSATTYYVWMRCIKGTGANSKFTLWIGTTTTKPGIANIDITTGTAILNPTRLQFYGASGLIPTIDQVIVTIMEMGNIQE